jgi:predicted ATPase
MLALYRSGRQAEALEAYRQTRTTLHELGVEPSEELRGLEKQILTHDSALTPVRHKSNLPAQRTHLIGRGRELAEVLALVRANTLVTLTGAGGSGKTRLALAAASELLTEFADGVWFVSLASLTDPTLVEPTIAHALGVHSELDQFLHGKQLLLLLDNLEQLLPEVAATVARLETKVLGTSRERLNLTAEYEYVVPTLPLDNAVELFVQRARRLRPRLEPDEHITEIARRLGGLPLALELAAARVKILTPEQIVERLGDNLDLVSGGGQDRPPRQRTLRATLEWSHDLLGAGQRRLFARLGIFAAGFDLETAQAVTEAEIDSLQSLLDKSLLTSTGDNGFAMLDTLRTFAREHLDPAELDTLRGRQFEQLEALAERSPFFLADSTFSGEARLAWLDEVEQLLPDTREVLAWALARDPARTGQLVCRLSVGFLLRGGGANEARTWLERLLQERPALPDEVLAEALTRLGDDRLHGHDLEAAAAFRRESIDLFRRLGDRMMAAWATNGYAGTLRSQGAYTDALALHEQALADFRDLDNPAMVAFTLYGIGNTLMRLGDFDRARETLRQAIATAESYGGDVAFMLHSLAELELEQRNLDDAEALYLRAHDSARDIKDLFVVVYCLAGLACIAALREDTEDAGERWGGVERTEHEIGERIPRRDRHTYEHILGPLQGGAEFRRGYEAGRTSATEAAGLATDTN